MKSCPAEKPKHHRRYGGALPQWGYDQADSETSLKNSRDMLDTTFNLW